MATTTMEEQLPPLIKTVFTNLEQQKTLITNCTNLYQTLYSHFSTHFTSLDLKSQTLDSNFQTLDSNFSQSLDSTQKREDSLPDLLNSLSDTVESRKTLALSEVSKPMPDDSTPLLEILTTMCRRMDPGMLMRMLVEKRRETTLLREKMAEAFSECVDPERFVIDAVREFVAMKKEKRVGLIDTRWACSMVVRSMFPPEKLKEGSGRDGVLGRVFAKKAVERAEEVLRKWKEVADVEGKQGVGEGTGMGPAESAMFIEVVLGFGLKEKFDEEGYYGKLMVEFCGRRDMAKLAIPIFGDKIADLIDELVKNGKEVEAVYFASESGLTERYKPVLLVESALQNAKKEWTDILKKGNNSSSATDKANSVESISIRSIIKCVEDHNIDAQFPVETLKKRLSVLEKARYDRKKGPTPSNSKRGRSSGSRSQTNGPPPNRPAKTQKISSPYQGSPAHLSPVSRYLGPNTYPSQTTYPSLTPYPSQTTYDTGLAPSKYVPSYGGSHVAALSLTAPVATDPITQRYGIPIAGVTSVEARLSGSYVSQVGYPSYDYCATATTPAYRPPYPQ